MKLDSVPEKTETYFPSQLPKSFLLVDQKCEKNRVCTTLQKNPWVRWNSTEPFLMPHFNNYLIQGNWGEKMLNHDIYHR